MGASSLSPFRGAGAGRFGADAEELAVFGEAAVGGVEDEIEFVDARRDGLSAELGESAEKGFGIGVRSLISISGGMGRL